MSVCLWEKGLRHYGTERRKKGIEWTEISTHLENQTLNSISKLAGTFLDLCLCVCVFEWTKWERKIVGSIFTHWHWHMCLQLFEIGDLLLVLDMLEVMWKHFCL